MRRILVIEDDPDIALSLRHALERESGYQVAVAADGEAGLDAARDDPPQLVILDLNLPGMDGLDVCRRLKRSDSTREIPIIMLTARVDEADKVTGLELGADDYIAKPFSVKELVARVRALLRRVQRPEGQAAGELLRAGEIELDEARRRVSVRGEEVTLTRREFDLLSMLMSRRGRVLTRDKLLERVWGYDHPGATRTVDVHVRQLRKKLGPAAARRIETVVGVGYRFQESDS